MGHADFPSEQLRNDSYPQRQNKKYVRQPHLMATWQLIRLPSNLLHGETHREYHGCETKQYHSRETDPSCIGNYIFIPVRQQQQANCTGNTDTTDDYANERQHPS